mmetsp:Transcript_23126/g.39642  ORF Transcript_23126/g.39642 Transcript_23126/m.39642 type:complete len:297 (-) Transcript_23126:525-1415(-)
MRSEFIFYHLLKLFIFNDPIPVQVNATDGLLGVLHAAEDVHQVRGLDVPPALLVEVLEGHADVLLADEHVAVHHRRQELLVVEALVPVQVDALHEAHDLRLHGLHALHAHGHAQLLERDHAVAVVVDGAEHLPQVPDLSLGELIGDDVQRVPLELVHAHELLQPVAHEGRDADRRAQGRVVVHLLEPGVRQRLLRRGPVLRALGQQLLDQVLGLLRDRVPLGAGEVELRALHAAEDLRVVVPVEGRVPAQQDVHDHPDRPQVTCFGVVPSQHLRSNIVGCTNSRCHDPLFAHVFNS